MNFTANTGTATARYARSAAEGFLKSFAYYDEVYVPVAASGGPGTPAWFENRLGKVFHALLMEGQDVSLPEGAWRGDQWRKFANEILASL